MSIKYALKFQIYCAYFKHKLNSIPKPNDDVVNPLLGNS